MPFVRTAYKIQRRKRMNDLVRKTEVINELVALTAYKTKLEITKVIEADFSRMDKWLGGVEDCLNAIEAIQPVDAVPIVHAHWRMYSYDEAICSNCGYDRSTEFESTSEAKERWSELPKFCENCGAKMRAEQEKNCSDCHYATKLKSGAYRCRRKRYDIAAKSCFKPKEEEEGTEQ